MGGAIFDIESLGLGLYALAAGSGKFIHMLVLLKVWGGMAGNKFWGLWRSF